ncbi:MAG: hypothetical protein WA476_20760 [Acidobacteriaceae bacterium]
MLISRTAENAMSAEEEVEALNSWDPFPFQYLVLSPFSYKPARINAILVRQKASRGGTACWRTRFLKGTASQPAEKLDSFKGRLHSLRENSVLDQGTTSEPALSVTPPA